MRGMYEDEVGFRLRGGKGERAGGTRDLISSSFGSLWGKREVKSNLGYFKPDFCLHLSLIERRRWVKFCIR
jgi:hypothetical protein